MLSGRRVLLGVCGGIAAYKSAELARRLTRAGAEVTVVLTANARRFVAPLTFRTLTGRPVATKLFSDPGSPLPHISLAQWAELIVIAPATADALARTASGRADDLLAAVILDAACPILWAPAMNTRMWQNPLTQKNLTQLQAAGHQIILPGSGDLACGEVGAGRLAEVDEIVVAIEARLARRGPLAGVRVLLTVGPTREPWDGVRYLTNASSGKMGFALAQEALRRGADVTVIAGPVTEPAPQGVRVLSVTTAQEMFDRALAEFPRAQIVVAAAAVSDYRPAQRRPGKLKKTGRVQSLKLVPNPDILLELGRRKTQQLLVGFALESKHLRASAAAKLRAKHLDLIIANPLTAMGSDRSHGLMLDARLRAVRLPVQSKPVLATLIWNRIETLRKAAAR